MTYMFVGFPEPATPNSKLESLTLYTARNTEFPAQNPTKHAVVIVAIFMIVVTIRILGSPVVCFFNFLFLGSLIHTKQWKHWCPYHEGSTGEPGILVAISLIIISVIIVIGIILLILF